MLFARLKSWNFGLKSDLLSSSRFAMVSINLIGYYTQGNSKQKSEAKKK